MQGLYAQFKWSVFAKYTLLLKYEYEKPGFTTLQQGIHYMDQLYLFLQNQERHLLS